MFYKQLFKLNIFHDYYQDKVCPDFSIEPTPECSRILSGHRLIIKNQVNGIMVIASVNLKDEKVELAENLQFTFILKLKNNDFINFTDLEWQPVDNNIYQFSNQTNSQESLLELAKTQTKLPDRNLSPGQNIFAIVDIYNNSSLSKDGKNGNNYQIHFQAKKQYWYYCLISDKMNNGNEFVIKDNDTTRETKIEFKINTNEVADQVVDLILFVVKQQFPQSQLAIFKSNSEIACQEVGIKNIQLLNKKNSEINNPTVWIEHLPNPPNSNGIEIINALKYL